jgi:hypothetical protein
MAVTLLHFIFNIIPTLSSTMLITGHKGNCTPLLQHEATVIFKLGGMRHEANARDKHLLPL